MARAYDLLIRARGETRDAQRAMAQLQRSVKNFGKGVRNVGALMTASITVPVALAARAGFQELIESSKVAAATGAVLESTGKSAGISAKHVAGLAEQMMNLSGIDDEVIQGAENIALRFDGVNKTNLRQVTQAITDIAATGKNADMAAKALGKALTSPEKAGKALLSLGVKLTAGEEKRIKALVKAGKAGDAQAIIMGKVNRAYAGQAAALGQTPEGKINRLKEGWSNLAGDLATLLLPALERLLELGTRLKAWFDGLSPRMQKLVGVFALLAAAVGPVLVVVGSLITASAAIVPVLASISLPMIGVIAAIAAFGAALVYLWKTNDKFRDQVKKAWAKVRAGVMEVLASLKLTINQWTVWAKQIWSKHGAEISAGAMKAWETVKSIVGPALGAIRDVILVVLAALRGDWGSAWDAVKSLVRNFFKFIVRFTKLSLKVLWKVVKASLLPLKLLFSALWTGIRVAAVKAWGLIKAVVVRVAKELVTQTLLPIRSLISTTVQIWNLLRSGASRAWGYIRDAVVSGAHAVVNFAGNALSAIGGKVTSIWSSIRSGVSGAWGMIRDAVVNAAHNLVDAAGSALGSLIDKASSVGSKMAGAIRDAINGILRAWNRLKLEIPAVKVAGKTVFPGASVGTPDVPLLAKGGDVTRSGAVIVGEKGPEMLQLPRGARVSPLGRGGMGATINVYPQSQDVEAIARRVAFLLGSGRVRMGGGVA